MRTLAFVLSLLALPLSASIWFDPPNPTSRTPVVAHILEDTCNPAGADVSINGRIISITLKFFENVIPCLPLVPGVEWTVDLGDLPAGVYDVRVGYQGTQTLIEENALAVSDAASPLTLEPNVARTGGDRVTITGSEIAPVCSVAPCPQPVVTFGGTPASVVEVESTDTIVVQAPVHDRGVVDVTVSAAGMTQTATAAFDYFDATKPFDSAFFEPVLFPVMVTGPGAFGSRWSTEVSMRNENDYVFPVNSIFDVVCFPVCESRPAAHSTVLLTGTNIPNGTLLYVPRQAAPSLSFGTLARDLSRQAEALGTEIPVVRDKDLFDHVFTLLNVPTDSRFRVALRVYRIDDVSVVLFKIWPMFSEDAPLVDTYEDLVKPDPTSSLSYQILYIGDLVTAYPQLAGKGPLRIEINPLAGPVSPQRVTWAFVSVTNNETQDVTIISPH